MAEKSDRARKEEEILKFWKENKIFEKSLGLPAGRQGRPRPEFVFYDGPPFATGLPHYGHILPGTIKDVIPRYKTMRGYKVPRRWGWDCHGLPIENLVETELNLKTKKDIEKYGVAEFNKRAKDSVLRFEKEWKELIPRTGRWIDMDNSYKTMDSSYTESVWWSFKQLFDKNLIYKGFKSMHLCPRCETTLSNFEVNQGYKEITDISVIAEFKVLDKENTYILAWTTTPWTLLGNVALAVNPDIEYAEVTDSEPGNIYILAKSRVEETFGENHKVLRTFSGKELVGTKYKTLFDYYLKESQVYGADFVTAEEGTGIVHIAPAFGEDDYELSKKENLPFIQHVGTDGRFKPEVEDFAGELVKPKDDHQATDIKIIKYLATNNLLFDKKKVVHSYPHCWRCDTPLLNYAASSWFVKVTDLKDKLLSNNRGIKWVPDDIREGRFGKWLEGAKDWAVSRSRFWGTPLPVWQAVSTNNQQPTTNKNYLVIDSMESLKKYTKKSGNKYLIMRHGEAKSNATNTLDLIGDPDNHLTENGKEEIKNAKVGNPDLVFASPFLRTQETAKLITEKFETDERLREMGPEESGIEARHRMGGFLFDIENKYKDKTILIISHGEPLWWLEKTANGEKAEFETGDINTGEVREMSFVPYPHNENYELDLHRPYIDEVVLEKDGKEYKRIKEVFDTWYDSGSVSYASRGAKDYLPADFIAEGQDQTRGWFYTMLVLATALFGKSSYKQVVVNGLILAEDGKKMSKRLGNYPELTYVLDKYGGDALRYYLMSSPAVHADDLAFSEKGLDEVNKKVLSRLDNVVSFYELYKNNPTNNQQPTTNNILDKWIDVRLHQLISEVTKHLDKYELERASRPIADFVDDLSTWYLRRSRNRPEALPKLREVLLELSKIMAPFMPFMAEDIYRRLDGSKESVHLEDWPPLRQGFVGQVLKFFSKPDKILRDMEDTRRLVSLALEQRQKANIKVRQPLSKLEVRSSKLEVQFTELIKDEVNVKEVVENQSLDTEVSLDTNITPELAEEGEVREEIRAIQDMRKEKNLNPTDSLKIDVPEGKKDLYEKFKKEIQSATNVEY